MCQIPKKRQRLQPPVVLRFRLRRKQHLRSSRNAFSEGRSRSPSKVNYGQITGAWPDLAPVSLGVIQQRNATRS